MVLNVKKIEEMMRRFEEFSTSDDETGEPELLTVMYKRDGSDKLRSFKMFSHRNSGEVTRLKHFAQQLMRYENRKKHRPKVTKMQIQKETHLSLDFEERFLAHGENMIATEGETFSNCTLRDSI